MKHRPVTCLVCAAPLLAPPAAWAGDPDIGPPVRIDVTGGTAASNETTGAVSPANPDEIVAAWNDWRESTGFEIIRVGAALSLDGGDTWEDFLVRPPAAFQTTVEGDPMTAADPRTGTLWVGGIAFGNGGMFVARKDPGARSFEPAVMTRIGGGLDKPWMAAGPRPGAPDSTRIYIAYNEGVQWSDDLGDTWTAPVTLGAGLGFLPRVGPAGELYVAQWFLQSNEFRLQRSLDGGDTFTTHTIAVRMDDWGIETFNSRFPGTMRVPPLAYIAIDPASGRLYAVYMDTTEVIDGNANVDLYFTRSSDQGETWSTPFVINGDGDPPGDQFFPWLEVDATGRVHLVFFDSRHTDQDDNVVNGMIDTYYACSTNGGVDWSEHRLTSRSWDSDDDGLDRDAQFLGDYLGMGVTETSAFPIYLDTTAGDTDVFTNVITFAPPFDADVNDDGVVDVEDLILVVLQWGPCPPGECPADTNGDGEVDVEDLVNVILGWD